MIANHNNASAVTELNFQTFFLDTYLTKQPFLISNGKVYTLRRVNKSHKLSNSESRDSLECFGEKYLVEEGEHLSQLESKLFEFEKEKIENFISRTAINYFNSKMGVINEDITHLKNLYSAIRQNKIEVFLKKRFLFANMKNTQNKTAQDRRDNQNSPPIFHFPWDIPDSIESIKYKKGHVKEALPCPKILFYLGRAYRLEEVWAPSFLIKSHVKYNNTTFKYEFLCDLEELEKKYRSYLMDPIAIKAIEYGNLLYQRDIKQKRKEQNTLKEVVEHEQMKSFNDLGFERLNDGRYLIYLKVRPYIIKKHNNYYVFDKTVRVGSDILFSGDSLKIEFPPQVLDIPYTHDFVHFDGKICYGNYLWFEDNIDFNKFYRLEDKDLPSLLVKMLSKAERVLTRSFGGGANQNSSRVLYVNSRQEAIRIANSKNILLERIFDNDTTAMDL